MLGSLPVTFTKPSPDAVKLEFVDSASGPDVLLDMDCPLVSTLPCQAVDGSHDCAGATHRLVRVSLAHRVGQRA